MNEPMGSGARLLVRTAGPPCKNGCALSRTRFDQRGIKGKTICAGWTASSLRAENTWLKSPSGPGIRTMPGHYAWNHGPLTSGSSASVFEHNRQPVLGIQL